MIISYNSKKNEKFPNFKNSEFISWRKKKYEKYKSCMPTKKSCIKKIQEEKRSLTGGL